MDKRIEYGHGTSIEGGRLIRDYKGMKLMLNSCIIACIVLKLLSFTIAIAWESKSLCARKNGEDHLAQLHHRSQAFAMNLERISKHGISRRLGVARSTIYGILKRYRRERRVKDQPSIDRLRFFKEHDDRAIS